MSETRTFHFSRIRSLLGFPKEQTPNPHTIGMELLSQERNLAIALANTGKPWAVQTQTITTVAAQADYAISFGGSASIGKATAAYRVTNDADAPFVPVEFTDYATRDFGKTQNLSGSVYPTPAYEKLAFWREGLINQVVNMTISPIPSEVVTYWIDFASVLPDSSAMGMSDGGVLEEFSDVLCIRAALSLLPYAEWDGLSRADNTAKRQEISAALQYQLSLKEPEARQYIKTLTAPSNFSLGYCLD